MQCAWFLVALVNPTNRVNQAVPYNMDLVESGALDVHQNLVYKDNQVSWVLSCDYSKLMLMSEAPYHCQS